MHFDIKHIIHSNHPTDRLEEIRTALFSNRGLTNETDIQAFLNPTSPLSLSVTDVGIKPSAMKIAVTRIRTAIAEQQPILIYGDYDADGITATAILWESLHALGAIATPFIPNRERHGYGLSVNGFTEAITKVNAPQPLIITVDNGITANEPIQWIKKQGFEIILTDHHTPGSTLPAADAIVHTTALCGAGVAWMLSKEIVPQEIAQQNLDLACVGTVADMMPVIGVNRSFIFHGLKALQTTSRPGFQALFVEAGVDTSKPLTTPHIGFAVAPRLNAMGRLDDALDSLRLLCTKSTAKATELAHRLGDTNRTRQDLTVELLDHAKSVVDKHPLGKVIIIDHESYHEGIIGLIAGKLVETYYRPSIVISRKDGVSKASARSIPGVNITDLIRSQSHLLVGVGGHPMAAGFSIETEKVGAFQQSLTQHAETTITDALLTPTLPVDCQIQLEDICEELHHMIQQLQPFGIGNHQPLFTVDNARIVTHQRLGNTKQHLKVLLERSNNLPIEALWFGKGEKATELNGYIPSLAFTVDQNTWKGKTNLQLMIKAIS